MTTWSERDQLTEVMSKLTLDEDTAKRAVVSLLEIGRISTRLSDMMARYAASRGEQKSSLEKAFHEYEWTRAGCILDNVEADYANITTVNNDMVVLFAHLMANVADIKQKMRRLFDIDENYAKNLAIEWLHDVVHPEGPADTAKSTRRVGNGDNLEVTFTDIGGAKTRLVLVPIHTGNEHDNIGDNGWYIESMPDIKIKQCINVPFPRALGVKYWVGSSSVRSIAFATHSNNMRAQPSCGVLVDLIIGETLEVNCSSLTNYEIGLEATLPARDDDVFEHRVAHST